MSIIVEKYPDIYYDNLQMVFPPCVAFRCWVRALITLAISAGWRLRVTRQS